MTEFTEVFEIPRNGGRRAGAGRKPGYSPKKADDLISGLDDGTANETTRSAADFAIARARKEKALADLNELDYKVKSSQYVSRASVQQASATALATLAQGMRSISDNLERRGVPPDVCIQVEAIINEGLADIARDLEMMSGGE